MKILLTGSTGFIGQKIVQYLLERTEAILSLPVRRRDERCIIDEIYFPRVIFKQIGNITSETNWCEALVDCEVVVHAAARVHVMDEQEIDPLMAFREINVDSTLNLARQAVAAGVRRFIYLSSIKVNGEYTQPSEPFGPDDMAMPEQPYSISKYEAEQGLMKLAKQTQMEVVIIRPPLVYGPGVKGNFLRMMQMLQKGIPLPFGALNNNKRSFVSIDNLVDLIVCCMDHSHAANQIFLVSDGHDLSTTDLLRKINRILKTGVPLLPVPVWMLNKAAKILGKEAEIMRLCGSLQVDISKLQKLLNWKPVGSVDDALYKTVQEYVDTN